MRYNGTPTSLALCWLGFVTGYDWFQSANSSTMMSPPPLKKEIRPAILMAMAVPALDATASPGESAFSVCVWRL